MPTPREFWEKYGSVYSRLLTFNGATGATIPRNPDRYLLVFLTTNTLITIAPDDGTSVATAPMTFDAGVGPVTWTHPLHGAMVEMGWKLLGPFGTVDFRYVEGIMPPKELDSEALSKLPRKSRRPAVSTTGKIPPAVLEGNVIDSVPDRSRVCVGPDIGSPSWFPGVPSVDDYTGAVASGYVLHRDRTSRRWYRVAVWYEEDTTPNRDDPGGDMIPPRGTPLPRGWVGWIIGRPKLADWHVSANNCRYILYDIVTGMYYHSMKQP